MSTVLKTIYKSVLKELFLTFIITLAFLNSVLMMEKLLRLSRLLSGVGASLSDMSAIILYLQPQFFILTIPMSLLLATLLVYGGLNQNNEIVVLRASGVDFKRISLPVMVLGLLCFAAGIGVSFYLSPKSSVKLRNELAEIITSRSAQAIEEGTFNSSFRDIMIMVKGKKSFDTLENIFIYDSRKKGEPMVLMAKEGKLFMQNGFNIGLQLADGYINYTKGSSTTEMFFDRYRMTLYLENGSPAPKKHELTPFELLEKTKESEDSRKKTALYLEFHRRLSLPAVCVFLTFLGTPLSLMAGKSGRLGGLAIGLFVFTAYYTLLIYGENLALSEKAPHYIAAWTPTFVLGVFALLFFRRESLK